MARKHKKNKKPGKGRRIGALGLLAALALLLAAGAAGALNASLVRIRRAEVQLRDLPAAFDGVRLLYASDIDLCGVNTAEKSAALFGQLRALEPDMLLLGGDYTSSTLLEILNRPAGGDDDAAGKLLRREAFLRALAGFDAPLGKFAIAAPEDPDRPALERALAEGGIQPLFNGRTRVERGGGALWLAGICEDSVALNSAGAVFANGECVIAVAHSPSVLPVLLTGEAGDGGQWADLVLCGHTHGGQIRLFGRSVLPLNEAEQRRISGWSVENGLPILVTQGVGCEGLNVRLGSKPEVWLITLRRAG